MSEPSYGLSESQFADRLIAKIEGQDTPEEAPEETPEQPGEATEQPTEQPVERPADQPEPEDDPLLSEYLSKYGGDRDKALKAAAHQQDVIGRQGAKLGELRQRQQQMEAFLAGLQQQAPQQPQYNYSIDQIVEAAEQSPQETAFWAIQNAPQAYDTVMDVWYQTDAKGASRFEQQIMAQALREQIRQEMAPAIQPAMDMSRTNAFYQAWAEVAQSNPEINNHTQQILEAAESAPEIVSILRDGDIDSKKRMLTQLYWMARGRNADTLAAAAQGVMQQQNAQNQYAKNQAQVVTSPGSGSADTTRSDRVAAWKREFRKAAGLPLELPRE